MRTIRVATINIWGEQPPLVERMELLGAQLNALSCDVIALQEVRAIPGLLANQAQTLGERLGMEVHYRPATEWGGGEEGLAILSRFAISERLERELPHAAPPERRIVLGARLETPLGPLAAFTTHLNYRLTDGKRREDQVVAAEALVAETQSPLPKLWMGDFNAVPESDEIRYLRGLHTVEGRRVYYQDAYAACHRGEAGYTWARRNPYTERLLFLEPDRRIDYIFVSPLRPDRRGTVHRCELVLDQPSRDGVFPSDHFGLLAEIQIDAGS